MANQNEIDALLSDRMDAHGATEGQEGEPLRPVHCLICDRFSGGYSKFPPAPYYCSECRQLLQRDAEYREMDCDDADDYLFDAPESECFGALWRWLVFGLVLWGVSVGAIKLGRFLLAIWEGGER